MTDIQFTSVERILSKLDRELPNVEIDEEDAIEWIGEALDFLKMPQLQEEIVTFVKVVDHHAELPEGFQSVLQVSRYSGELPCDDTQCNPGHEEEVPSAEDLYKLLEQEGCSPEGVSTCTSIIEVLGASNNSCHTAYFGMQWDYMVWNKSSLYQQKFSPIRLANSTLFNSLVCREVQEPVYCSSDEYTIVGTTDKRFRFSFEEGVVAVSYLRSALDKETGYPLVPDVIQHQTAITYYVKWKVAERLSWDGRDGFVGLKQDNERLWLKYVKQAKNWTKMPKTIDQFQNLLEETHRLIPNHNAYYNYFGKLGRKEI